MIAPDVTDEKKKTLNAQLDEIKKQYKAVLSDLRSTTRFGTRDWMAPEVITDEEDKPHRFTKKSLVNGLYDTFYFHQRPTSLR